MSEVNRQPLAWAVLAPAPPDLLVERVARAESFGEAETERPEVVRGDGAYSAIVSRDEEGDDELLAETLSSEFGGTLYLLRLRDEREAIWAYEAGELVREVRDDPFRLAASLGCRLPGWTDGPPVSEAVTLCVVEGATPAQVARALGEYAGRCEVRATAARRVLVTSEKISIGILAYDLAAALPRATLYRIINDPAAGRFGVAVLKGEQVAGNFESLAIKTSHPALSELKGETTPSGIASALGVPPELLNLKASP
jgi:hypothetical protein